MPTMIYLQHSRIIYVSLFSELPKMLVVRAMAMGPVEFLKFCYKFILNAYTEMPKRREITFFANYMSNSYLQRSINRSQYVISLHLSVLNARFLRF